MGRGPPYQPAHDLTKDIPKTVWAGPRHIPERIQEIRENGQHDPKTKLTSTEQALYAIGILSMGDLKKLQLDDK